MYTYIQYVFHYHLLWSAYTSTQLKSINSSKRNAYKQLSTYNISVTFNSIHCKDPTLPSEVNFYSIISGAITSSLDNSSFVVQISTNCFKNGGHTTWFPLHWQLVMDRRAEDASLALSSPAHRRKYPAMHRLELYTRTKNELYVL